MFVNNFKIFVNNYMCFNFYIDFFIIVGIGVYDFLFNLNIKNFIFDELFIIGIFEYYY